MKKVKKAIMMALSIVGVTMANGQTINSLGIMVFNDEGILFVGDNISGSIPVSYTHLTLPTICSV